MSGLASDTCVCVCVCVYRDDDGDQNEENPDGKADSGPVPHPAAIQVRPEADTHRHGTLIQSNSARDRDDRPTSLCNVDI